MNKKVESPRGRWRLRPRRRLRRLKLSYGGEKLEEGKKETSEVTRALHYSSQLICRRSWVVE